MGKIKPKGSYNGGKNGSGVYQALINLIPPHDVFVTGFAGYCGVLANKAPAATNIIIDLDNDVLDKWRPLLGSPG